MLGDGSRSVKHILCQFEPGNLARIIHKVRGEVREVPVTTGKSSEPTGGLLERHVEDRRVRTPSLKLCRHKDDAASASGYDAAPESLCIIRASPGYSQISLRDAGDASDGKEAE